MEYRPCIDVHNGKVKQIVGSSLDDEGASAQENFVSKRDADFFAEFYAKDGLRGGHVILLNKVGSPYYEDTKRQALLALQTYPNGLQVGGGINADNAQEFLDAGASHVIVTSYVFSDGKINYENLQKLVDAVGKEHIVLDLSCRRVEDEYFIVTDRWQNITKEQITYDLLDNLATYCDEFLIHAADVEGKSDGIERDLVELLGGWGKIPMTYAGGISTYQDIEDVKELGQGHLNITIGTALDLFGGPLNYETVLSCVQEV
ncbi:MAG: phosphoribosylformimino-5-aminoimidazole carboxamide ribotide isomerase [Lachnospiraceae bacterium]|jgi:phosphoribosylformimino-5-aminoimidazole carboxamide ribotide isomerase|nr:phosphoribosylformimino-5-aminoimidazole carboxamide ribotide isomerase [Lachnospiraceae bacterium]MBO6155199.1 phosphoribosylformimino-5-aminoimidazole carboxamide ribotide isomerase [Lachnospiraceae bacterium]MBQ1604457.1 phosphoribosylformimino-5-aminoimidazole carboxamide ribotide isomerase [Lachnospiraceae bacterium]MBQ2089201.1 phosphoribosylformimino-5-aminoimidazole carboxamide ribotide isomerase [Lachnospiraceae bacterium]MBQ4300319.1 phosphoribosylformimino-5-aminoimidazole carboxa